MHTGFWWGNQRARDHLGDPEVDVSKFIKLNLKSVGSGMDLSGLRQGQMVGCCKRGNEH
jgi:hypothetical protein